MKAGLGRGGAEPKQVDVTWEDQNRINRFGALNVKMDDIKDQMKIQMEHAENLDDAVAALEMVMDDGDAMMRYGDIFIEGTEDDANEFVERLQSKVKGEISESKMSINNIEEEMIGLKGTLYAKFGNSINLETTK